MGQKHALSPTLVYRKPLFCLFSLISAMFMLSCLWVMLSSTPPRSISARFLPNSKFLSIIDISSFYMFNRSNEDDSDDSATVIADGEDKEDNSLKKMDAGVNKCIPLARNNKESLKIFMYDLPSEFHFQLLDWKERENSVWPVLTENIPKYPGGLNLQHSIEYWLTLDLLSTEVPGYLAVRSAIRVRNSSEADVVFVPFFSSLSYNRFSKVKPGETKSRDKLLQEKLVEFVTSQPEWRRSRGVDHIILAHHPNSMIDARYKLWQAMFVLADFGRYPPHVANVQKDIIAPYKHMIRSYHNDSSDFDSRPTLLYFQGAIYRKDGGFARQELFYLLKEEKDVHFQFGSVQEDGVRKASVGMHSSKFCLNIAGDTPSSNRLFDAIASHCVPVIISDDIELPFEDVLDYSEFCLFVRTSDAIKKNFLINFVRNIGKEEWTRMWLRLKAVESYFEFQYPSMDGDAIQMIWQAVARKVPAVRLKIHRSTRFSHSNYNDSELRFIPTPANFG